MKRKVELNERDLAVLVRKALDMEGAEVTFGAYVNRDCMDRETGGHTIWCEVVQNDSGDD